MPSSTLPTPSTSAGGVLIRGGKALAVTRRPHPNYGSVSITAGGRRPHPLSHAPKASNRGFLRNGYRRPQVFLLLDGPCSGRSSLRHDELSSEPWFPSSTWEPILGSLLVPSIRPDCVNVMPASS